MHVSAATEDVSRQFGDLVRFSGPSGLTLRQLLGNFAQFGAVRGQSEYMEATSELFWSVYKKHVFC